MGYGTVHSVSVSQYKCIKIFKWNSKNGCYTDKKPFIVMHYLCINITENVGWSHECFIKVMLKLFTRPHWPVNQKKKGKNKGFAHLFLSVYPFSFSDSCSHEIHNVILFDPQIAYDYKWMNKMKKKFQITFIPELKNDENAMLFHFFFLFWILYLRQSFSYFLFSSSYMQIVSNTR